MRTSVSSVCVKMCLLSILSVFAGICAAAPLTINPTEAPVEAEDERKVSRQIALQGILGKKALLLVDGERLMLSVGQAMKFGVRVLRIGAETVDITVDGKPRQLHLGDSHSVTGRFQKRKSIEVTIFPDKRGMYNTVGSINGLPVSFLVDTGATTIAMNKQHARRLAVDYLVLGKPIVVGTASGMTKAYQVTLDKVSVGGIGLRNVVAVVMDGNFPVQVLLGMSFLKQLKYNYEGSALHLIKTF